MILGKTKFELMEQFEESYRDAHGFDCSDDDYDIFFQEFLQMKDEWS